MLAAVRVGQAGNDFQECRLPGTVEADEAQFLTAVDGKGHVVEEDPQAVRFLYMFYCQYIHYMLFTFSVDLSLPYHTSHQTSNIKP